MPPNINIGELVAGITLDASGLRRGLRESQDNLKKSVRQMSTDLRTIGLAIGAMGGAVAGVGLLSLRAASDVEEMRSKFNVVFGDLSGEVEAWAASHASAVNRSRFELQGYLASLQDTFVPMGFARDEAAQLAQGMTQLAIDVGSFNNVADDQVLRDFQSALVGNTETVRKYGVVITEARLKAFAYEQGIAAVGTELTEQQKLLARYQLIVSDTSDAHGDAARTSGSFANQMKGLQAAMHEVQVEIGTALLPTMTSLLREVTPIVRGIVSWAREHHTLVRNILIGGAAFAGLGTALAAIGFALPAIITGIGLLLSPIGLVAGAIVGLIAALFILREQAPDVFDAINFAITAGVNETIAHINNLLDALNHIPGVALDLVDPVESAFGAVLEPIDSITDVINEIQTAMNTLVDNLPDTPNGFPIPEEDIEKTTTALKTMVNDAIGPLDDILGSAIPKIRSFNTAVFDMSNPVDRARFFIEGLRSATEKSDTALGNFLATWLAWTRDLTLFSLSHATSEIDSLGEHARHNAQNVNSLADAIGRLEDRAQQFARQSRLARFSTATQALGNTAVTMFGTGLGPGGSFGVPPGPPIGVFNPAFSTPDPVTPPTDVFNPHEQLQFNGVVNLDSTPVGTVIGKSVKGK